MALGFTWQIRLRVVSYNLCGKYPPPNPKSVLYPGQNSCSSSRKVFLSLEEYLKFFSSPISANIASLSPPFLLFPLGRVYPFKCLSLAFNLCYYSHFLKPWADLQIKAPSNQCPYFCCFFFPPLPGPSQPFTFDLQESFPMVYLFIYKK